MQSECCVEPAVGHCVTYHKLDLLRHVLKESGADESVIPHSRSTSTDPMSVYANWVTSSSHPVYFVCCLEESLVFQQHFFFLSLNGCQTEFCHQSVKVIHLLCKRIYSHSHKTRSRHSAKQDSCFC